MLLSSRLLTLILLQCLFVGWSFPVYAARLKCADHPVAFEYEKPEEIKCVCETARAAIKLLKTLGLETTEVITIRLIDSFPSHQMHNLIGYYHPGSREVELITYSKAIEFSQNDKFFLKIDASEDVWCSYAAHELAHAISSPYINQGSTNHTAGEYISAVTQLTVLAPESRQKILKKYENVDAYKSMSEISILYFLFAPNEFAVKSYLHFMALDEPKVFIERLLKTEDELWERF